MIEVGTKLIRTKTGQHYVVEKTELSKIKGKLFKKEVWYYLKSEYHNSLDLIVHEDELKSLFTLVNQTIADKIRSLSDEELAKFLINFKNTFGTEYEGLMSCFDWLQSEAEIPKSD